MFQLKMNCIVLKNDFSDFVENYMAVIEQSNVWNRSKIYNDS